LAQPKGGVFIALEGSDAAGITTQSRLLAETLGALYEKEPTHSPIGAIIRGILSRPEGHTAEELALLFAADRIQHLYRRGGVLWKLVEGRIVVMDRYKYSSIAYQAVQHPVLGGAEPGWLWEINRYAPPPHILVYLHAAPEALEERLRKRRVRQTYEHPELLPEIRKSFEENVLQRLPETCSPSATAWGRKRVQGVPLAALYPEGHCYPMLITVDTTRGTIDTVNKEILGSLKRLIRRLHIDREAM